MNCLVRTAGASHLRARLLISTFARPADRWGSRVKAERAGPPAPSGPVQLLVHDRPLVDWDDRLWGRRSVSEGAVGTDVVVVASPSLDQGLRLVERVEDLGFE